MTQERYHCSMRSLIPDRKALTWKDHLSLWLRGLEIRPVNEHQCAGCGKWDHEQEYPATWYDMRTLHKHFDLPFDYSYDYLKVCECGHKSKWIDTGFMGAMGQIRGNGNVEPECKWGAFDHAVQKSRR